MFHIVSFCKKIRRYLSRNWIYVLFYTILAGLLIFFYLSEKNRLIFGGIILIIIGAKVLLENIKSDKIFEKLIGLSEISVGLISLTTKYLLLKNLDAFILITIIIFVFYFLLYNFLMQTSSKLAQIVSLLFLVIFAIALTATINPVMQEINSSGFKNIYFYLATVFLIVLITMIYFIMIRTFFNLLKKSIIGNVSQLNNYSYLALSITILTLSGGYYYLSTFSEDKLRDFLFILSIAFFNNFAVVSAMKSLDIPK